MRGVHQLLRMSHLPKDLLVTIDGDRAARLNVVDYQPEDGRVPFRQTYSAQKYNLKDPADHAFFQEYAGDLGLVVGWNRLIPPEVIGTFKYGCLGLHGTPLELPRGRGRSPVIWTLALGFSKYNFYLFKLGAGADDGPIYDKVTVDVTEFDTSPTVYAKLIVAAALMLDRTVPKILAGTIQPTPQPSTKPVYFRARGMKDGEIHWRRSTRTTYNLIRAITTPYPCAHTHLDGQCIKIIRAIPFSQALFQDKLPGEVCAVFADGQFVVKTGDGTLLVQQTESPVALTQGQRLQ